MSVGELVAQARAWRKEHEPSADARDAHDDLLQAHADHFRALGDERGARWLERQVERNGGREAAR